MERKRVFAWFIFFFVHYLGESLFPRSCFPRRKNLYIGMIFNLFWRKFGCCCCCCCCCCCRGCCCCCCCCCCYLKLLRHHPIFLCVEFLPELDLLGGTLLAPKNHHQSRPFVCPTTILYRLIFVETFILAGGLIIIQKERTTIFKMEVDFQSMYTIVKVDGATPKSWLSKRLW